MAITLPTTNPKKILWDKSGLIAVLITTVIRIAIYDWLYKANYFYGYSWDTFSRTYLSYLWFQKPFLFTPGGGYWLPFQFWIVGITYKFLSPLNLGAEILVPVVINNFFFLGTLFVIYKIAFRMGGRTTGLLACVLVSIFSEDIFTSYSAFSEPIWCFFILLAAYYTHEYINKDYEKRTLTALILSVIAFLAATTHYIGWFLMAFVCLLFIPTVVKLIYDKENHQQQIIGVLLMWFFMLIVPFGWLLRSYIVFDDFLHPFHSAAQYQQGYIGQMPILERMLIPISTLFGNYTAAAWGGLLCIIFWAIKKPGILTYLSGVLFIFFGLWLTTIMAYSAPYQEPRYFVFLILGLFPLIAYTLSYIWSNFAVIGKTVSIALFLVYVISNSYQVYTYKNYFGPDVPQTAKQSLLFLQKNPEKSVVILETDSFAEQTVIPITGKYFWKYEHVTAEEISQSSDNLSNYFKGFARNWLGIIKSKEIADRARAQGLNVDQIGSYYLISP